MFKKMIAIITSVIILLTPIQASAVTWGAILTGLQASDTFKDGETTAARTSEGEYVISGGKIDDPVEVSELLQFQFSDSLKVLFQNIGIERLNANADNGKTIVVILGSGSEVTDRVHVYAHGKDTNLSLTNEGKMGYLEANVLDQAQASIKNNGEIMRGMHNGVHDEGSRLEFVNDKDAFNAVYYTVLDALNTPAPQPKKPQQESFYQTMTVQQYRERAPQPEEKKPEPVRRRK